MARNRTSKKAILLAHEAGFVPCDWSEWSALVRRAARAQRLAELRCNGSPIRERVRAGMDRETMKRLDAAADAEEQKYERLDELNDEVLRKLAAHLGLEIDLSGDPRGAVVKVRGQGIRGNSWGGGGWFCVA